MTTTLGPSRGRASGSRTTIVAVIAAASLAPVARGAALLYEGFNYPLAAPLPGLIGGLGWSAPWTGSSLMYIEQPTLSHSLGLPSTGLKERNPNVGEAFRPFVGGAISNAVNDLWLSFMEQTNVAGSGTFVSLDPSSGPQVAVNKDGAGTYLVTVGGGPAIGLGLGAGAGNTDLVIFHFTQFSGSTTIEGYLNSNVPSFSLAIPVPVNFSRFYFRTDPMEDLDEIRAGTLPTDVAAVPSPGAAVLAGLWSLLVARRRNRAQTA